MSRVLHDLAAADGRRFSPHCWRSTMALAHKGLACESRATPFTAIGAIGDGVRTLPVLDDGGRRIADSWAIAEHLEAAYPDRPSLFGGEAGRSFALFMQHWTAVQMQGPIFRMIVADVHAALAPADQRYFRASREQRLGRTLEAVQAERERELPAFRAGLAPLRALLQAQPFVAGAAPAYADYLPFGALQWARLTSPLRLLADDDPVLGWFDRCLDLFGGLGRSAPAREATP